MWKKDWVFNWEWKIGAICQKEVNCICAPLKVPRENEPGNIECGIEIWD